MPSLLLLQLQLCSLTFAPAPTRKQERPHFLPASIIALLPPLSLSPHTNTKPEKNTKTPNTKSNTKPKPDALRLFQPLSEPVRAFQQLKKRRRSSCGRNEAAIAAFTKTASRQLLLRQTVLYVTFILLPP